MSDRRPETRHLQAVIFDMDGILIDTEAVWRAAEIRVFGDLGLRLTDQDGVATMGMRIDEVVDHWFRLQPWSDPSPASVAAKIVDAVIAQVQQRGEVLPGVRAAIQLCQGRGLCLAVASSSPYRLIDAVLNRLDLGEAFPVRRSAEDEEHGKPFPDVYLRAAHTLGVAPQHCVAIEDSASGVTSALAAGLRCIAIPDPLVRDDPRVAKADLILDSLVYLDDTVLDTLAERMVRPPSPQSA